MLKINYIENGICFSDFKIIEKTDEFLSKYNYSFSDKNIEIDVSTENFIHAIRLFVARKKIDFKDIVFIYKDKKITLDNYGAVVEEVKGFANCEEELLDLILYANFEQYKGF